MSGVQSPPMHLAAAQGYTSPAAHYLPAAHQQSYQQAAASLRPGTLPPGVGLKIGAHEVTIERFLSEGGFAHVYLVRSNQPISSPTGSSEYQHVLKRVAVPDKETLKEVRWEVDVMKLLRGHKYIVNLIEASAAPIPGTTGYEVFILMEYCSGGGIIDMMNTRLQNRLTEAEILKIFSDVVEAVCWMHTRDPPLMHRDLKVENILLAGPGFYKVCDFGSSTTPKTAPQSMQEIQLLEAELNKHTTLQYRAPEMCDVWSRKEIGLPADIWALGVLLYKLCYYTTPFEEQGPLAILNAQYKIPSYPSYSADMKALIASMLLEQIKMRPTAYQVHHEVCRLRGVSANDSYKKVMDLHQSLSTTSLNGAVSPSFSSRPGTGLDHVVSGQKGTFQTQSGLPTSPEQNGVSPMRRGRPNKPLPSTTSGQAPATGLQSEWQVPRQGVQASLTTGEAIQPSASPSLNGFADSFAPDMSAALPPAAQPELTGSKTAAAQAAIWEELANPGSTAKNAPTLASLAASRTPQIGQPTLSPNQPATQTQDKRAYYQQLSLNPTVPSPSGQDLRRVSPGKPLGPRPNLASPTPSTSSFTRPTLSTRSTSTSTQTDQSDSQLTGPPPLKPKPHLVSRASQTSPTLLNQWKQKEQEFIKGPTQPTLQTAQQEQQQAESPRRQRTSSLRNAFEIPQRKPPSSASEQGGGSEIQRFPSIDDWEASGFTPPPDTTNEADPSRSDHTQEKQHSVDLLGEEIEEDSSKRMLQVRTSPSRDLIASPEPISSQGTSATTDTRTANERAPSSLNGQQNVVADGTFAPPAQDSSSEDGEGEPEPPTGQSYARGEASTSRLRTSSDASWSGQVAPQQVPGRGPPILAPKPKTGGISSIVSRYENISIAAPEKSESIGSGPSFQSKSVDKPVKPPKPTYGALQNRQGVSGSSTSGADAKSAGDDFDSRFPSIDQVDTAISPPLITSRPNNGSSGSSTTARIRPQSMFNASNPSTTSLANARTQTRDSTPAEAANAVQEEDEEYQGVANLRDRWQQKMQNGSKSSSEQNATNLERRTSTLGTNRWNRA